MTLKHKMNIGLAVVMGGLALKSFAAKDPNILFTFGIPMLVIWSIVSKFIENRFSVAQVEEEQQDVEEEPTNGLLKGDVQETTTTKPATADRPNASVLTAHIVGDLPEKIEWPIRFIKPNQIPLLSNGKTWKSLDLHASEHVVVCGSSRSGKGYLLQLAGLSALMLGPDEVQVWFLDAKQGLDYSFATQLVHARLYADIKHADGSLGRGFDDALEEMEQRNGLLFGKARNVHEYAQKTGDKWPIILLIVDEAAELDKLQKEKLCTLARMSAASGFVIMTSTQYPTVDVLSSQIQANALIRICLKLPSGKYTPVALSLAPGEQSTYDPASIEPRGVAIHRYTGKEMIGRIPEVTDEARDKAINWLKSRYGRSTSDENLLHGLLGGSTVENDGFGQLRSTSLHSTLLHFRDEDDDPRDRRSSIPMPRSDTSAIRSSIHVPTSATIEELDLPNDPISVAIRQSLSNGSTRNEVATMLGGSTRTAYKRIWIALGEKNEGELS